MKKLLFAGAFVCMALGFSACGNTLYCYELTATVSGVSVTQYIWTTSNAIDAAVKQADPTGTINWKYQKVNKSQSDCVSTAW
jgi:ABC-type glycerol-3-phosphate transport system substrate-binding protein